MRRMAAISNWQEMNILCDSTVKEDGGIHTGGKNHQVRIYDDSWASGYPAILIFSGCGGQAYAVWKEGAKTEGLGNLIG